MIFIPNAMSVKEALLQVRELMEREDFAEGFARCRALVDSADQNTPQLARFSLYSSYGFCALKIEELAVAEKYLKKASELEAPLPQMQKNLKVGAHPTPAETSFPSNHRLLESVESQ